MEMETIEDRKAAEEIERVDDPSKKSALSTVAQSISTIYKLYKCFSLLHYYSIHVYLNAPPSVNSMRRMSAYAHVVLAKTF